MPIQAPQWTEFLSCPICCHEFDGDQRGPISLGCGHTVCKGCLSKLQRNQCPYDQTVMRLELDQLPVNGALLSLVNTNGSSNGSHSSSNQGHDGKDQNSPPQPPPAVSPDKAPHYFTSIQCIKELALLLKPFSGSGINGSTSVLSRPMQRKLVTLINCQLVEEEGRARSVRAARSLGERTVTELILHHQNHHQLSANLWAAVRSRGCQFLGPGNTDCGKFKLAEAPTSNPAPAMQEEVLKLVLLALEDGSALSRKVLVMFVVQRLEPHFPQASKTSIGHVVQLLYRASCFKVSKREGDSSLMQLKEEFRTYEALRREHDAQIVQIATEAGLRIAPDQWSSLLYGDTAHKSHMQSIIDKLQTPQSFGQSVQELVIALQRTGDPGQLSSLRPQLELLAGLDPSPDSLIPGWELCASAMEAIKSVVIGLVKFIQHHGNKKITDAHHAHNAKYKTSMCRDLTQRGGCPRGNDCTFAHSEEELEKFRSRSRKQGKTSANVSTNSVSSNNKSPNPIKQNSEGTHSSVPNKNSTTAHSSQRNQSDHKKSQTSQINLNHNPIQTSSQSLTQTQQIHHNKISVTSQSSIVQNHVRQALQPPPIVHQMAHSELVRPILKNGERQTVMPLMGKHLILEDVLHQGLAPASHGPYDSPNFMQVAPHSQPLPVISAPPQPGNIIQQALAPPPPPTPVFATPIPEYAYGAYHPQGPIFATGPHTSTMSIPAGVPTGMHPSAGGPPTPVFSQQHPSSMLPELFTPNPQTLLVNQGQLYNLVSPARDFSTPVAETRQTNSIAKSVISSWPEMTSDHFSMAQNEINFTTSTISSTTCYGDSPSDVFASKSLTELKERKEEILSQLENIVGKEAIDEVAIQVAKGEPVSTTSSSIEEYPSTYSIWTSGANLTNFSFGKKSYDKSYDPAFGYRTNAEDGKHSKDDFVPFDPPVHSRFGPISRMTRPFLRPSNAIQVSACNTTDPVTTPTVHRPVPAISPMPQVLYQHPGFTVGVVSYPPNLEYMNTVGHGIIDPPHLHMSQLEPSGSRPSDPIMDFFHMGQEERQRQQFIVAKEGLDVFCLNQKFEEMRLKEELNLVVQGIQEKKKEIEQDNRDNLESTNEEDMTDFEKNWNFDFDECEKE